MIVAGMSYSRFACITTSNVTCKFAQCYLSLVSSELQYVALREYGENSARWHREDIPVYNSPFILRLNVVLDDDITLELSFRMT